MKTAFTVQILAGMMANPNVVPQHLLPEEMEEMVTDAGKLAQAVIDQGDFAGEISELMGQSIAATQELLT